MALTAILMIAALASVPLLRPRFLPRFNENDLIVHFQTAPGTSLETMLGIGQRALAIIKRMPEVAHVVMHVGRAHLSNGNAGTNKAEAEIDIGLTTRGSADSKLTEQRILAAVQGAPGVRWWATTDDDEHYAYAIAL